VRVDTTKVLAQQVSNGRPSGVFCRLLLDKDKDLRDWFLGTRDAPDNAIKEAASMLMEEFRCCLF